MKIAQSTSVVARKLVKAIIFFNYASSSFGLEFAPRFPGIEALHPYNTPQAPQSLGDTSSLPKRPLFLPKAWLPLTSIFPLLTPPILHPQLPYSTFTHFTHCLPVSPLSLYQCPSEQPLVQGSLSRLTPFECRRTKDNRAVSFSLQPGHQKGS